MIIFYQQGRIIWKKIFKLRFQAFCSSNQRLIKVNLRFMELNLWFRELNLWFKKLILWIRKLNLDFSEIKQRIRELFLLYFLLVFWEEKIHFIQVWIIFVWFFYCFAPRFLMFKGNGAEFLLFCYFAEFSKSILLVINFNDSFNNLVFLCLCEAYRFSS